MTPRYAIAGLTIFAGLGLHLLTAAPAPAPAPLPMFGGSIGRNMVNLAEKAPPTEWDLKEKKGIKWVAKVGSRAYGGPTIGGGRIYVGTNNASPRNPAIKGDKGVLMCFDEATGKFLWQHVNDKLPAGNVVDWPQEGVCSTPTVEGDRVYYVSNRCEIVCLDAKGMADGNQGVQDEPYKSASDADVIWRYDLIKELNVFPHNMTSCSPLVVGDLIFVITANGVDEGHINLPSPDAPSFVCVNKTTGKLVWKDASPGRNIMHGQWANPAYLEVKGKGQVVFPGGDGYLYSFDPPTGKLVWKFDCNPKASKYELGGKSTKSDFIATPVAYDGKVIIGTGQDPEHFEGVGHLWCIDPSKAAPGQVDMSPGNDNFDPNDPANSKSGMVWHYGGPDTAPNKQRDYVYGRTMSTVSIHDGLVYAAELAGYLHCVDFATGKRVWTHDLKGAVWGSTIYIDGRVYVATEDGDIYIFEAGKEKKDPVKIEMEQPVRSTPVMSGGVMYLLTESNLVAVPAAKH